MKLTKQSGFSLVELMCVVAIVGVLASMGMTKMRIYQMKARQSEAITNLSALNALTQSYFANNGTFPSINDDWKDGNGYEHFTVDVTAGATCKAPSSDGCNCQNQFGFSMATCAKARYTYWYARPIGPPSRRYIYAIGNRNLCPAGTLSDRWIATDLPDDPTASVLTNYYSQTKAGGDCVADTDENFHLYENPTPNLPP